MGFWNVLLIIITVLSLTSFCILFKGAYEMYKEKNKLIKKLMDLLKENNIKMDISDLESVIN